MRHTIARSILTIALSLTISAPVLANPSHRSNGHGREFVRDQRQPGKIKKVKHNRIDRSDRYGRSDRYDRYDRYELARRARLERLERERIARIERARRQRIESIIRARREACYGREGRNRTRTVGRDRADWPARGDRGDVLNRRVEDIILGRRVDRRVDRCDGRRPSERPRIVLGDPRSWPDRRDRDWPDRRDWPDQRDWPVPTYPRQHAPTRMDASALAVAQRALEILRTAP